MPSPKDTLEPSAYRSYRNVRAAAAFFILLGGLVLLGGIAIRRGGRGWSPLIWVTAVVYLLFFPLGTLLGYVVLKGLPRYWESVEQLRG